MTAPSKRVLLATVLPAMILTGCASTKDYPSLARRPAEKDSGRISGSAPVVAPAPDASASQMPVAADLTTRLAQLMQAAREAHARFDTAQARANSLVSAARGTAVASERWSVATVAIAELESSRSDAMVSLGELDRLYAEARIAGQNDDGGDGGAIAAVRDQVTAWVADEDAVLADLGSRMPG
ncbi:MAG: hypothetical protein KKA12_04475 [Alphaproteobacteria bacterium]|nr:hypothetical protein [Alphaproteobacteria bacterium]